MIHLSFDRSFWYCVFLASQSWLRRGSEKTLEVAFCSCISSEVMTLQVHFSSVLKRPSALTFKLFLSLVGILGFSACCLQFGLSFVQSEMIASRCFLEICFQASGHKMSGLASLIGHCGSFIYELHYLWITCTHETESCRPKSQKRISMVSRTLLRSHTSKESCSTQRGPAAVTRRQMFKNLFRTMPRRS